MSSAPEELRCRAEVAREQRREEEEQGVVVFPGAEMCHVGREVQEEESGEGSGVRLRSLESGEVEVPTVTPGLLVVGEEEQVEEQEEQGEVARLGEAEVMATLEELATSRPKFPVKKVWESLVS